MYGNTIVLKNLHGERQIPYLPGQKVNELRDARLRDIVNYAAKTAKRPVLFCISQSTGRILRISIQGFPLRMRLDAICYPFRPFGLGIAHHSYPRTS
jgi:hypothetical protein